jgi:hypothetical protein
VEKGLWSLGRESSVEHVAKDRDPDRMSVGEDLISKVEGDGINSNNEKRPSGAGRR